MPRASSTKLLLAPIAAGLLAIAAVLISAQPGGAQTPVPTAYPTPVPTVYTVPPVAGQQQIIGGNVSICGVANPGAVGGQTITDPTGALSVTLTEAGNYTYGPPSANVGQPALAICHQQTNSTVVISTVTGREITRVSRDGLAPTILNRIVAGARLTGAGAGVSTGGTSTGAATTPSTAAGSGTGVLRPPSTGDAGLR